MIVRPFFRFDELVDTLYERGYKCATDYNFSPMIRDDGCGRHSSASRDEHGRCIIRRYDRHGRIINEQKVVRLPVPLHKLRGRVA